jgi:protein tyrosine/serine phosphatase
LLVVFVGIAVAAAAGGTGYWLSRVARRQAASAVSVVQEGVLYRSGQPEGDALEALCGPPRFGTVISLRENQPEAPWQKAEAAFCRANGIRFVSLPLSRAGFTRAQLAQFLEIVQDPTRQPVLVHCERGRNRTGYAVAVYRIAVQHWTYDAAVAEAVKYGFVPTSALGFSQSLRALASGAPFAADAPGPAPEADPAPPGPGTVPVS